MTILVTGGAGLIGRFVVKELVEAGHDVVSADLVPPAALRPRETFERVDIGDAMTWTRLLTQHRPDAVIHLGAMITHTAHQAPVAACQVNVMGTAYLFEAARLLHRPRIVYASTIMVYGPPSAYQEPIVTEDAPLAPNTIYGATKAMDEAIAAHYRAVHGIEATGLRPTVTYGPKRYEGALGSINRGIRDAVLGRPVVWSQSFGRDVVHNPIHASDIARAFVRAAVGSYLPSPVYNMGGVETLSEDDILRIILEAAPQHGPLSHGPASPTPVSYMRADFSRFHRDANFAPTLSFHDAVKWAEQYYTDADFRASILGAPDTV